VPRLNVESHHPPDSAASMSRLVTIRHPTNLSTVIPSSLSFTIPVVSFSSSLSPLLSSMPPIHSLSPVTSSFQSNQPSPGQEFQVLQERIGWWIACARVVGTLEWSPPCRSCGVPHLRAWSQRIDRVHTEYPWPLVSFRFVFSRPRALSLIT